jgi:hypothetical protein
MRVSGQHQALAVLYLCVKDPGTHWIGGWGTSEVVWTQRLEEKYFASVGDRTPVAHYVVTDYTD